MEPKYNLFFVPHLEDRRKISQIRSKICKKVYSTKALQFPVHMSLVSSSFKIKDFSSFEKELKKLCKKQNKIILKTEKTTSILPDRFWTGIHITNIKEVRRLQDKLQVLRNKFADKKQKHPFHPPHITLAFPAEVEGLKEIKCPLNLMTFDRITIVKKDGIFKPCKILKHINFG